jgi:WD40 repeat protein
MNDRRKSQRRRTSRWIVAIGALAVLVIAPSAHAATTFVYGNAPSGTTQQRLYKINATTGAVVTACPYTQGGGFGRGIAVVGNLAYYTVDNSNNVFVADINTCTDLGIAFSISKGAAGLSAIAYDGTNFWIADYSATTNKVFYVSPTGTLLQTITLTNCAQFCDGLEFFNGKLIANRGDAIPPYDIYSTAGTLLPPPSFITTSFQPTGIAFDGTNFYVSDISNQKLQVYNGTTGAFLNTITITGMTPGADEIEDLSFDYAQVIAAHPDPCCPPWNSQKLAEMLVYQGTGGISAPFTLQYQPTPAFNTVMTAYTAYLNAVNPDIFATIIQFNLHDGGAGPTCDVNGPQIDGDFFRAWTPSGPFLSIFTTSPFFPPASMVVNHWYLIHSGIFLNNGLTFFPASCSNNDICVRLQVQAFDAGRFAGGPEDRAVLQIRMRDGSVIERPLSAGTPR